LGAKSIASNSVSIAKLPDVPAVIDHQTTLEKAGKFGQGNSRVFKAELAEPSRPTKSPA
jgi:hypothetical protein